MHVWEALITHIDDYLIDALITKTVEEANVGTRLILLVGAINAAKMAAADTEVSRILDSILEAGGFKVDDQQ